MDTAIALNVCATAIHISGIWEVFVIAIDCVDICTHTHTHTHVIVNIRDKFVVYVSVFQKWVSVMCERIKFNAGVATSSR